MSSPAPAADDSHTPAGSHLLTVQSDADNKMSEGYLWKSKADSESEGSEAEPFLVKGAFLLTPAPGLSAERASALCDKVELRSGFSITRTATGLLFKFGDPDDCQLMMRKNFHKLTGSRFYRKVPIPCRPRRTFSVCVYEVPDEVPEDDLRLALRRYSSVLELCRVAGGAKPGGSPAGSESGQARAAGAVLRVTLGSASETEALLARGLDFFGASCFPADLASPAQVRLLSRSPRSAARVRDLLPVFDHAKSRLLNNKK